MPQRYREWLNRDVAYIITNDERDAFKLLSTDAERDNFIERFWELRNPTPGAPDNPFRTEHYRRLAYAIDHFGSRNAQDGWRTDQGRIYITLGEPKQKATYNGLADIRPMEIWFYSAAHPALPAFFYVVFYQREHGDQMRLYSPYADGPEKLVTTLEGTNDRRAAFRVIDRHAGREVARTTLSLIPSEPVDLDRATTSLQSDVVLAAIRNLANHPLTRQMLANKRELLESVTHRVVLPGEFLNVVTVGLRDPRGDSFLHYALGVQRPDEFSVGTAPDGRRYYSIEVRATTHDENGKVIFSQVKSFSRYLGEVEFERVKQKLFGFEGMLPLAPGKYKIDFQLTDKLKRTTWRAEKSVSIAGPSEGRMAVSEIVPFDEAEPVSSSNELLPFAAANVKFTPLLGRQVDTIVGGKLKFFYQLWAPARDPAKYGDSVVKVQYAYGRPGGPGGGTKTIVDEVRKSQFDSAGSLVNGKSLDLEGAPPGSYVLAVSITDSGEQVGRTHVTVPFRIVPAKDVAPSWHIYDNTLRDEEQAGTLQYQRALAYMSHGDKSAAERWFRMALDRDPSHPQALAQLSTLLYERNDFSHLTALLQQVRITEKTDDETVIRLADGLDRTGQSQRCIELLEQALKTRPESGTMYLALASLYRKHGNNQRAEELEKKGRQLVTSTSM